MNTTSTSISKRTAGLRVKAGVKAAGWSGNHNATLVRVT
jgi:hypothetical protein